MVKAAVNAAASATTSPPSLQAPPVPRESRSLYCLLAASLVSILFVLTFSFSTTSSPSSPIPSSSSNPGTSLASLAASLPPPPSLAYLLTGSAGDVNRLLRLLQAVYHPRNVYLLHLDLAAPQEQRVQLALSVQKDPIFEAAGNVHVIGNADFANPRGSSSLAATLHGASVLLRLGKSWDWFLNLEVSDYPLVTQDDLLHILSFLPRDLNFIQHTSQFTARESHRVKPIVVDPGLYLSMRMDIFYGTEKRGLPDAYQLFTGSSSIILSRKFIEFCILGTDNIPRTLLMYYANTPSPQTNYFQTVICNSKQFNKTVVNHNLLYAFWDAPPKRLPRMLGTTDFDNLTQSGAAFSTRFPPNDPVLDRIDAELLNRLPGKVVPGGWCLGMDDPCVILGDPDVLRPDKGSTRLGKLMLQLLDGGFYRSHQCILE